MLLSLPFNSYFFSCIDVLSQHDGSVRTVSKLIQCYISVHDGLLSFLHEGVRCIKNACLISSVFRKYYYIRKLNIYNYYYILRKNVFKFTIFCTLVQYNNYYWSATMVLIKPIIYRVYCVTSAKYIPYTKPYDLCINHLRSVRKYKKLLLGYVSVVFNNHKRQDLVRKFARTTYTNNLFLTISIYRQSIHL